MSNLDKTKQIYAQVGQGKLLEAFEANYAENIVMEEPSGRREGKEACRKYEEQFINNLDFSSTIPFPIDPAWVPLKENFKIEDTSLIGMQRATTLSLSSLMIIFRVKTENENGLASIA